MPSQSDFTPNDPKGEAGSKKAPMWLLPPAAMEEVAWVHRLGSEKYGPYNWRKTGVCATTYVSAIMRHLNAWRDGEDLDPESGFSHIAHIATSCNILIDAARCGTLQDDRNRVSGSVANEPDLGSWLGEDGLALIEAGLEAQRQATAGTIEVGDFVKVVQVESPAFFCARVEKVIDIRGTKVYGFDNGQTLDDSEIFSITKLS